MHGDAWMVLYVGEFLGLFFELKMRWNFPREACKLENNYVVTGTNGNWSERVQRVRKKSVEL